MQIIFDYLTLFYYSKRVFVFEFMRAMYDLYWILQSLAVVSDGDLMNSDIFATLGSQSGIVCPLLIAQFLLMSWGFCLRCSKSIELIDIGKPAMSVWAESLVEKAYTPRFHLFCFHVSFISWLLFYSLEAAKLWAAIRLVSNLGLSSHRLRFAGGGAFAAQKICWLGSSLLEDVGSSGLLIYLGSDRWSSRCLLIGEHWVAQWWLLPWINSWASVTSAACGCAVLCQARMTAWHFSYLLLGSEIQLINQRCSGCQELFSASHFPHIICFSVVEISWPKWSSKLLSKLYLVKLW